MFLTFSLLKTQTKVTKLNRSNHNGWYSQILIGRQICIRLILRMKFATDGCRSWLALSHSYLLHCHLSMFTDNLPDFCLVTASGAWAAEHLSVFSNVFCCHLHLPAAIPETCCPHFLIEIFFPDLLVTFL